MYRNDKCRRCDAPVSQSSPIKCVECELACYCSSKCQADDRGRHEVDCQVAKVTKECSGCGASKLKRGLKQCSNCLDAWYCRKECQKRHWPRHKPLCESISQEVISLTKEMAKIWSEKSFLPPLTPTYYWGNIPAVDLINLSMNEGSGYTSPLSLLLCGVGDPRNVALSLAQLPESYQEQLTFVLNDISVCTLARTVMLLYMLWEGGQEEAQTITQIWYSLRISEHSNTFLNSALRRLVCAASLEELTCGVMTATAEHFRSLKRVWQKWLHLNLGDTSWITEERTKNIALDDNAKAGIPNYLSGIPSHHRKSAEKWFKDGIMLPKGFLHSATRGNVTLTGSWDLTASGPDVEFSYCVMSDMLPFTCWDYKDAKKFHDVPSLVEIYSEYVSHVSAQCTRRLVSGQVKLHCILSNCLEMNPFLPGGLAFDRVLTSNLCDYIPLPTLLGLCKPLLNQANSNSVIVTESFNWSYRFPEIQTRMIMGYSFGLHESRALQDTGNSSIASSSARTSFVEYYDLSTEFQRSLRARLLLPDVEQLSGKRVPSLKALALKHGLVLRDYLRNENQILPHRWPINCRRVSQLNGFERTVEWVLSADK